MKKRFKVLLILGIIVYCIIALYPSYSYYRIADKEALTPEQREKFMNSAIKLGLDLQGGMHVVMEIDDSGMDDNAKRDAIDRAIRVVRNRIDEFGVAEPVIQQQGDKRLIVQLPGLQDPERVRKLIGRTALLEFRLSNDSCGGK